MIDPDLHGVAATLLVPLACRAIESARPDGILHDGRAEQVFQALGNRTDFLMGMRKADQFVTVMRARQFDCFARAFLSRHSRGVVVDLGCGLDTRFERIDNGKIIWYGIDLPEVIQLRRILLADNERCFTIAQSIFETSWLDQIETNGKPVLFLAEGIFPYFSTAEIKPLLHEMAQRWPDGEIIFDAASPYINRHHNRNSKVLKRTGVRIRWDVRRPEELETWGLRLLESWYYFDKPEPRLRAFSWMRLIPGMAKASGVYRFRLSR